MMCKFCIGRRFSIDNLRIVDWLENDFFYRIVFNLKTSSKSNRTQRGGERREASKPLRMSFRLYTSEAMGAQNYYYLKANDFDAINDFSGTVSEVCADL